jgi:hypothetical protein
MEFVKIESASIIGTHWTRRKRMSRIEDFEYAAFVFDVDKQEYVRVGRPVQSEMLCKNRLEEAVCEGWVPECYDTSKVIIKRRKVTTVEEEWEVMKDAKQVDGPQ